MRRFYEDNYRPNGSLHYPDNNEKNNDDTWFLQNTEEKFVKEHSLWVVAGWIVVFTHFFLFSEYFRWICIFMIFVYVGLTGLGGSDALELMLHKNLMIQRHDGMAGEIARDSGSNSDVYKNKLD